jgi:hypothetical protein
VAGVLKIGAALWGSREPSSLSTVGAARAEVLPSGDFEGNGVGATPARGCPDGQAVAAHAQSGRDLSA